MGDVINAFAEVGWIDHAGLTTHSCSRVAAQLFGSCWQVGAGIKTGPAGSRWERSCKETGYTKLKIYVCPLE